MGMGRYSESTLGSKEKFRSICPSAIIHVYVSIVEKEGRWERWLELSDCDFYFLDSTPIISGEAKVNWADQCIPMSNLPLSDQHCLHTTLTQSAILKKNFFYL